MSSFSIPTAKNLLAFIFTILLEELGVIAGLIVLIGYGYMIFRIIKISKMCYNLRNSIICYGVAMMFLTHLFINFLGILALMPLTGVPLPLLSYGGSFVINVICMICIVERIAYETSIEKNLEKIQKI